MERRRHRQRHGALGAHVLGHGDGALDCALVARQHDLARVIVVGDRANLALAPRLRRSSARAPGPRRAARPSPPTPTGTAACIAWPRSLSSFAVVARSNEPAAHKRGIFAEAVAGDKMRRLLQRHATFAGQRAEHRQRMRHDRRLGILGELEILLRPFAHQLEQMLARAPRRLRRKRRGRPRSPRQGRRPCRPTGCPAPEKGMRAS